MNIGTQLLHEAKAKLKAALTALKDELKNPDTQSEARDSFVSFSDEMDSHVREIGFDQAMSESKPAPVAEEAPAAAEAENKGEDLPNAPAPEAPAKDEHESLGLLHAFLEGLEGDVGGENRAIQKNWPEGMPHVR